MMLLLLAPTTLARGRQPSARRARSSCMPQRRRRPWPPPSPSDPRCIPSRPLSWGWPSARGQIIGRHRSLLLERRAALVDDVCGVLAQDHLDLSPEFVLVLDHHLLDVARELIVRFMDHPLDDLDGILLDLGHR